jgi:hypothetical protein
VRTDFETNPSHLAVSLASLTRYHCLETQKSETHLRNHIALYHSTALPHYPPRAFTYLRQVGIVQGKRDERYIFRLLFNSWLGRKSHVEASSVRRGDGCRRRIDVPSEPSDIAIVPCIQPPKFHRSTRLAHCRSRRDERHRIRNSQGLPTWEPHSSSASLVQGRHQPTEGAFRHSTQPIALLICYRSTPVGIDRVYTS